METNANFKHYLQNELAKRAKKNSRFSIRGFAKQLGLEPSSLAQILAGKRKLTDQMCLRIAERLALSPAKLRSLMKREVPTQDKPFQNFNQIQEDSFRVIADWYYYAILELTRTATFQPNLNWIAATLGISTAETRTAVERLKRLNYLQIDAKGQWKDCLGSATNTGNEVSSAALREHQKQLLKKASEALDTVPYEERVQSSMVLSGTKERVAEAKKRILNFIEELDEYLKTGESRDEVYTLAVSLFPVSNNQNQKPKNQGVPHVSNQENV